MKQTKPFYLGLIILLLGVVFFASNLTKMATGQDLQVTVKQHSIFDGNQGLGKSPVVVDSSSSPTVQQIKSIKDRLVAAEPSLQGKRIHLATTTGFGCMSTKEFGNKAVNNTDYYIVIGDKFIDQLQLGTHPAWVAFIIGHEVGHIVHKDLEKGGQPGEVVKGMERRADQYGAMAMERIGYQHEEICSLWKFYINLKGDEPSPDHPLPSERSRLLGC